MEDSCKTVTKTYQAFLLNMAIEPMNIHELLTCSDSTVHLLAL